MRLFRLLIVLSISSLISVNAQNKLTLDEAINLAYQKNIDLQKQFTEVQNAKIYLDKSARLPNPLFSYSREDLKSNPLNYNEWIASGSIPINFLWERWSNIDAKENSLEAQKLFYEDLKWNTAYKVRENYFALHNYSKLSLSLENALIHLSNLAESAQHRLTEGDISEYELQRILVELNKLKVTASGIEIQKIKLENNLKLYIGYDTEANIITIPQTLNKKFNYTENELLQLALDQRNDLKAFRTIIKGESEYISHNKLKAIPQVNLTAGYKKQSDDFKGSLIQLDFEVPLFNRNQTKIEQSEIQLSLLEKELLFLMEKIKTEVIESYQNYNINKKLYEDFEKLKFKDIFTISSYSYEQGEISLVEFIDGINAFIDSIVLVTDLEINYNNSFLKIENAAGISITNFE